MSITNLRELGGYETTNGKHVKKSCFYRSGPIVFKNEEEKEEFKKLNIKHILDLRSPQEVEKTPDMNVEGCEYILCSAISTNNTQGGNFDMKDLLQKDALNNIVDYIHDIYKNLPFHNEAYKIMFDLMKKKEVPFLFHCTAGKDRTGVAAYLILKTLGVSDEIIMKDYLLSNSYLKEINEKIVALSPQLSNIDDLLYVKEEYLLDTINAIHDKYKDFTTFLNEEYQLNEEDIKKLQEMYLV